MIRILIADRQEFFRIGLRAVLERNAGWRVVAEADTGQTVLQLADSLHPDVGIIDLSITDPSGLKVTQHLRSALPGIKLIAVSAYVTTTVMRQVRLAGARGFLAPNDTATQFIAAVESVLDEKPFFFPRSVIATNREFDSVPVQYLLSDRQLEVLRLLANGYSGKAIAVSLGLSTRTAESHVARIMGRLRTRSRVELVKLAVRDGVV